MEKERKRKEGGEMWKERIGVEKRREHRSVHSFYTVGVLVDLDSSLVESINDAIETIVGLGKILGDCNAHTLNFSDCKLDGLKISVLFVEIVAHLLRGTIHNGRSLDDWRDAETGVILEHGVARVDVPRSTQRT